MTTGLKFNKKLAISKIGDISRNLFLFLIFALVVLYCLRPNWSIDIYWHIKVGEWIVKHGRLPHRDIFSAVDTSRPWTTFQWLYEVIVYFVDRNFGFLGQKVLHASLYAGGFLMFYRFFRKNTSSGIYAIFFLIMLIFLSEDRLRLRPEAFNTFFLGLVVPMALGPSRKTSWKELSLLFLTAVLWGSIHAGGALMLPILFGGVLAGRFVGHLLGIKYELRADLWRFLASSAVLVLLPGFVKGVYTAFFMYSGSYDLIPEWYPPLAYFQPKIVGRITVHHIIDGALPYLVAFLTFVSVSVVLIRKGLPRFLREMDGGEVLVALGLALLGIKSCRFIFFSVIPLFLMMKWWVFPRLKGDADYYMRMVLAILSVLGLMLSYDYNILYQRKGLKNAIKGITIDQEKGRFPVQAATVMKEMGLHGRIFHYTQWGGYLLYRLYPECRVFTDGRGNFTPQEERDLVLTHQPYEREYTLEMAWKRYHFDIVMFEPPMFPLLTWDTDKWIMIYGGRDAEVFLRNTPENRDNIRRALRYWRTMGLVFKRNDIKDFQRAYLDLLSYEYFKQPKVQKQLNLASAMIEHGKGNVITRGYMDKGFVYFMARRYATAAMFLQKVLKAHYNPVAAIYLAWSFYNSGHKDLARRVLLKYFPPSTPRPGLGYGMRRIADLLAQETGLKSIFHTRASRAKVEFHRDNKGKPFVGH